MFGKRYRLFSLFGVDVRLDASWFFLALLVAWTLAAGTFPATVAGLSTRTYWAMGIAGALGLFASIVLHEFAHALVARRNHLPMRGITLFIFGGVAEMDAEPPSAKAEFLMAAAGPLLSIVLGGVLFGVATLLGGWPTPVGAVVRYLGSINLILAAFNLVPAFPLDGGRVLRAYLWHRRRDLAAATRTASRVGASFGLLLMVLGAFSFLFGGVVSGIWYFVLGLFLRALATASYQQVLLHRALEGETVRRFMKTDPLTVSPTASVQELVDDYVYRHHHKLYPVVDQGHLAGCVTLDQIRSLPRDAWKNRRVGDITTACSASNTIDPDADALDALKLMHRSRTSRLLVASNGSLQGVITLKDLLGFFARKMELEGAGT